MKGQNYNKYVYLCMCETWQISYTVGRQQFPGSNGYSVELMLIEENLWHVRPVKSTSHKFNTFNLISKQS